MKHPDDTDECASFVRARASFLIGNGGMSEDVALEEALDYWEKSLKRMQMITRYHAALRAQGKPTLHVSLFEAAKIR